MFAVTCDADGNTLTDTSGRTMTWDSQNRMASCTKGGTASTYGADGLRRSSTVSGVTTYYAYDGQTMIRERKKNTQTGALFNTGTYLQGPRGGEYRRDDTQVEMDSQNGMVSCLCAIRQMSLCGTNTPQRPNKPFLAPFFILIPVPKPTSALAF